MEQAPFDQQQEKVAAQELVNTPPPPPEPEMASMPPFWKSKRFLLSFLVLLLLIVIGAGGYFLVANTTKSKVTQSVPSPTASRTINVTPTITTAPVPSSWKLYSNPSVSFSFRYPEYYQIISEQPQKVVFGFPLNPNDKPDPYLTISVDSPSAIQDLKQCVEGQVTPCYTKMETRIIANGSVTVVTRYGGVDSVNEIVTIPGKPTIEMSMDVAGGGLSNTFETILSSVKKGKDFEKASVAAPTSSWKTFTHTNPSFSITYPALYFVNDQSYGVEFTAEKPVLDAPSVLNGFGISYRDSAVAQAFTDLTAAKAGDDVKSAQQGVDVKVTKLKNLTVDGHEAVEYIHDGTIPATSGLGRGPIPYSHIFLVKISDTSYLSILNASMQSADVTARDSLFSQMVTSLKITK